MLVFAAGYIAGLASGRLLHAGRVMVRQRVGLQQPRCGPDCTCGGCLCVRLRPTLRTIPNTFLRTLNMDLHRPSPGWFEAHIHQLEVSRNLLQRSCVMSSIAGVLTVDSAIWVSRNCELFECASVSLSVVWSDAASLRRIGFVTAYAIAECTLRVQYKAEAHQSKLLLTPLPAQKLHAFLARGRSLEESAHRKLLSSLMRPERQDG